MPAATKYFHDRLVLLLLGVNSFLMLLTVLSVLFRLQGGGDGYIVQYRANLGISAFKTGSVSHLLGFMAFALFVLVFHAALSWRTYHLHRYLAVLVLGLGTLLLVLGLVVSNALLTLH